MPAIVGGGTGFPRPGAVSLAHRGVLFLDEAPEFPVRVLDALRQPLESGEVMIARSAGSMRLPARFLLCLAANPCPCGRHSMRGQGCECTPTMVNRYQARLSGPLLDRVDLQVQVSSVTKAELMARDHTAESTATVAARVRAARERAAARLVDTPWRTNAEVPGHELRTRWQLSPGALVDAERDLERGLLTARGLDRVLRVSWTIADLAGRDRPGRADVLTGLALRTGVQRGRSLMDRPLTHPVDSNLDLGSES
jgi:magnesium chelatase family protein